MSTRFGVHTPSNYYWVPDNLIAWCEDAKRHGVGCVTVWANDLHQLEFCKALRDHDIEVIYRPGENLIPCQFIGGIYEQYRHVGVKMCQFYNEPNLSAEWQDGHKLNPEKFAEHWAKACLGLKSLGFIPIVPPLSPGGNLWHPEFFHRMMGWWKNQGMLPDLLRGCYLGIHNRPTVNPPDDPGVCAFEGYRYYRQWMMEIMGFTLPMVAPEAGYEPPNVGHDWEKWKDWNLELIRRFRPDHPKYVGDDFLWHNFWIYHDSGSIWDECGLVENWYYAQEHGGDRTTNLWRALEHEDWDEVPNPPEPPDPPPLPDPDPEPDPIDGDLVFVGLSEEMIETLTLSGPEHPDSPYWKVTRVEVQPQTDNMSAWLLTDAPCPGGIFSWPGNEVVMNWKGPDLLSPPGARQGGWEQPMHHAWGSFGMRVNGNSETLHGFGLYGAGLELGYTEHHPVMITFRWWEADGEPAPEPPPEPPEPPEPGPEPEPGPDVPYTLLAGLERLGLAVDDMREEVRSISRIDEIPIREFGDINGIVVHHTGSNGPQSMMGIAEMHINERGWPTIGYHFVVDFEGEVTISAPLVWEIHNCGELNPEVIGIGLMGDFTDSVPEMSQIRSLRLLIYGLWEFLGQNWGQYRVTYVLPHSYLSYVDDQGNLWHSACPGKLKDMLVWQGDWPPRGSL